MKRLLLSGAFLLLVGCGPQESKEPQTSSVKATDAFFSVGQSFHIDLSNSVVGGNQNVSLAEVYSEQQGCEASDVQKLSFNADMGDNGLCIYRYSISSPSVDSSANALVVSSSSSEPLLPNISQPTTVRQQVQLNLNNLLGSAFPSGFALNTTNIQTLGDMADEATVSATGNIITYTAPSVAGWNRLVYTLENSTDSTQKKLGV
ncbi:hypothetical protein VP758_005269, partial [Vibrio harveyi]|nr:hypothetical protein [Vibrio harveyi]